MDSEHTLWILLSALITIVLCTGMFACNRDNNNRWANEQSMADRGYKQEIVLTGKSVLKIWVPAECE